MPWCGLMKALIQSKSIISAFVRRRMGPFSRASCSGSATTPVSIWPLPGSLVQMTSVALREADEHSASGEQSTDFVPDGQSGILRCEAGDRARLEPMSIDQVEMTGIAVLVWYLRRCDRHGNRLSKAPGTV